MSNEEAYLACMLLQLLMLSLDETIALSNPTMLHAL